MVDLSEFESISPYTDDEAAEALSKLAEFPLLSQVSQQFFPKEEPTFLKNVLKSVKTIDEFQVLVMQKVVRWVIENTAKNFSYDGISNISADKKFLALSNHRDIILDPAITQELYGLFSELRDTLNLSILISTHDWDYVARSGDRVLVLNQDVEFIGSTADWLSRRGGAQQ